MRHPQQRIRQEPPISKMHQSMGPLVDDDKFIDLCRRALTGRRKLQRRDSCMKSSPPLGRLLMADSIPAEVDLF